MRGGAGGAGVNLGLGVGVGGVRSQAHGLRNPHHSGGWTAAFWAEVFSPRPVSAAEPVTPSGRGGNLGKGLPADADARFLFAPALCLLWWGAFYTNMDFLRVSV